MDIYAEVYSSVDEQTFYQESASLVYLHHVGNLSVCIDQSRCDLTKCSVQLERNLLLSTSSPVNL